MILVSLLSLVIAASPGCRDVATASQVQKRYHVLLIGVPEPDCKLFPKLDGVQGDLEAIAKVLEDNWHVPKSAIVIETAHNKTTKQGIEDLVRKTLIEPCKDRNDVVYFGYSGHGFQVFDDSKPMKLSQAIVPADARNLQADNPKKGLKKAEVDPDSLLTGPEIGRLFDPLKNVTSNVTLTFDSCHSGSITRGSFRARGRDNPAVGRYLARGNPQNGQTIAKELGSRGLVCLSAAAPDQLAWEWEEGGAFTHALVQALRHPGDGKRTYRSLFNEIRAQCSRQRLPAPQDPQIEGDESRTILGDEFVAPRSTIEIHMKDGRPVMSAGRVLGMKAGFLVGIYPEGEEVLGRAPKWTATITDVRTGESDLKLDEASERSLNGHYGPLNANAQAIVLDGKPDGSMRVYIGELSSPLQKALIRHLVSSPIIDLTAPANGFDYKLSPGSGNVQMLIDGLEGKIVETFKPDGTIEVRAASLAEGLESIARRSAILGLEPDGKPEVNVEMTFVRAELDGSGKNVSRLMPGSVLEPGQSATKSVKFAVRVRLRRAGSTGSQFTAYLSLLGVNPHPRSDQQRVQQVWPDPAVKNDKQFRVLTLDSGWRYLGVRNDLVSGDNPAEVAAYYVDADTDGVGPELFKLFATDEDEDFAPLLDPTSRGSWRRARTDLGRILQDFSRHEPRSRAGRANEPQTQHWCTASILVNVIPNPSSSLGCASLQHNIYQRQQ